MKTQSLIEQHINDGGAVYHSHVSPDQWAKAAKEAGLTYFKIDCSKAKTRSAVLTAIEHALDLPDHFGHNLDALYDCVTDLVLEQKKGIVIQLVGSLEHSEKQKQDMQEVNQVFEDAIEYALENAKKMTFVVD